MDSSKIKALMRRHFKSRIRGVINNFHRLGDERNIDGALTLALSENEFSKNLTEKLIRFGDINFSVTRVKNEKTTGADIKIIFEINMPNKKIEKWCFLQSKRFDSGFREFKRSQAKKMLKITPASFYTLYLPQDIKIISASNVYGLLNSKYSNIPDDTIVTIHPTEFDDKALLDFTNFIVDYFFTSHVGHVDIGEYPKDEEDIKYTLKFRLDVKELSKEDNSYFESKRKLYKV